MNTLLLFDQHIQISSSCNCRENSIAPLIKCDREISDRKYYPSEWVCFFRKHFSPQFSRAHLNGILKHKKLTDFGIKHCRLFKHCRFFSRTQRQTSNKNNIFIWRFSTQNFFRSRSRRCAASSAVSPTKKCKSSCWIFKDFWEDEKMSFCRSFGFFLRACKTRWENSESAQKASHTRDFNARPAANHFLPCKRKIVTTADKNEIRQEGSLRQSGAIKIQIRRLKLFLHSAWNWYSSRSNMFWIKLKHLEMYAGGWILWLASWQLAMLQILRETVTIILIRDHSICCHNFISLTVYVYWR